MGPPSPSPPHPECLPTPTQGTQPHLAPWVSGTRMLSPLALGSFLLLQVITLAVCKGKEMQCLLAVSGWNFYLLDPSFPDWAWLTLQEPICPWPPAARCWGPGRFVTQHRAGWAPGGGGGVHWSASLHASRGRKHVATIQSLSWKNFKSSKMSSGTFRTLLMKGMCIVL